MLSAPIEIKATIAGVESVTRRLLAVTPEAQKRVRDEVTRQGVEMLRVVKAKLFDDVLNVRTGRLRRSINEKTADDGNTFTSTTGTNVVYARIHEMGGTTKPHEIRPRNGKVLVWHGIGMFGKGELKATGRLTKKGYKAQAAMGNLFYAQVVHHPGSVIPKRSFLASSLEDRKGEIRAGLLKAMGGLGK